MVGEQCNWPKCKNATDIGWLGRSLCDVHWKHVCDLTESGSEGYLQAYEVLRITKSFWMESVRYPKQHAAKIAERKLKVQEDVDEFGDLPDADGFDYSV